MSLVDQPFTDPVLHDLSRRFIAHTAIYRGTSPANASPLYAALAERIASDGDILDLVRDADRATQVSNLLFGAVHYLLLSQLEHPLGAFYASVNPHPRSPQGAFPTFRVFCETHADAIRQLVTTQRVQTNEVQRCTGLLPAFATVATHDSTLPLALIEVGASAGLNLLWDTFGYTYHPLGIAGDLHSPVQLQCTVTGHEPARLPLAVPAIAMRVGIDLHPIDLFDTAATRWIRALIWPEQHDRAQHLDHALALAQRDPPHVIVGDAAVCLLDLLQTLPSDTLACVYHSYTLNQCAAATREQIIDQCRTFALQRPLVRIALEWYNGQTQPQLDLYRYEGTHEQHQLLAYCESHGRTIEWLA